MTDHAVLIAGAGPTGLMLAGELALAGIDVAIIERRLNQDLASARAGGLHSRTLEVLDQRGIAERFISQGRVHKAVSFHVPLDMSDLPTRHNYLLALRQKHIERILAEWVGELRVPIHRGREVAGFVQDDEGVEVELSSGDRMRTRYFVGCDGGRSVIRKTAGVEFPGWDATTSWLIAEAAWSQEPPWGFRKDALGRHAIGKLDDGRAGIVLVEREMGATAEPTLEDVRQALVAVYGTDFGIHSPTYVSRFTDMTRQAAAYRKGRVLLAGDAAHVHPPLGGQGLNIGVQDAVNLGWKLAQVVKGVSSPALLDTYHEERHPVGARVLRNTMAQVMLSHTDERTKAVGEVMAELLAMDEPRKRWAAEMSGLAVRYDLGEGHPLLGRRMPDLEVITDEGPRRVYKLLHEARPVMLDFGQRDRLLGPLGEVRVIDAKYDAAWEIPAIGAVSPPAAVLIRPDGYVAWAGDSRRLGLADALKKWFGA